MSFDTRDLATFQHDFLQQVTAPLVPSGNAALRVYRDTWFYGLIDVLHSTFEATARALGDEAFKAFARDYVHSHDLTQGDRNGYGTDFADFLARHPHIAGLDWLHDLARFEWALHSAHHAADADPANFEALLQPDAELALHPSVQVITVSHDIRRLHTALIESNQKSTVAPIRKTPCDLLIARNRTDEVITLCLAPMEVEFIGLIALNRSLFLTLDQMAPNDDDMTVLQSFLARLVQNGLLTLIIP